MIGLPVVTSKEMKDLEARSIKGGESEEKYVDNAGKGIAELAQQFLWNSGLEKVYLLIGKGNKGGDAFTAGALLLAKGFPVIAYHLFPLEECSELSRKKGTAFEKAGGKLVKISQKPRFEMGLILDGLLGTGFQGAVEGKFAEVIDAANQSGLPIFAIDIPSGLNGNTGEVKTLAIEAHTTVCLGLPKLGFFLGNGWNYVGYLEMVDFGLPKSALASLDPVAYVISEEKAAGALPKIVRNRHKYQTGYVLAVAGSKEMPGAALMASLSALRGGAGIIRLFYPEDAESEFIASPLEVIKEGWNLENDGRIFEEEKRAKALLIGPGCGRSAKTQKGIKNILAKTHLPTVIDADALYFLSVDKNTKLPKQVILTPHHQEMHRLIDGDPTYERCQEYVEKKNLTLVLKGAPTVIFHPQTKPLIIPYGDPGMAKAGTGDVLTGLLAALLAQGLSPQDAAALGVYIHALAGESAASTETSYCMLAQI